MELITLFMYANDVNIVKDDAENLCGDQKVIGNEVDIRKH
jgi:hypothetical protein